MNSLHKEYAYGNISQKMANNTYTDMTPPTMMSYPLSNFCCLYHCQWGSWGTTGTRQLSIQENTQSSTVADITVATAYHVQNPPRRSFQICEAKLGMKRLCMVIMLLGTPTG